LATSGKEVVSALRRIGYVVDHQRGSHIFMHNLQRNKSVVVPLYRELKNGPLHAILRKTSISLDQLGDLA
jgi:predicted RNA binding protein YcfA (HicA-like mRNA interferase family)